MAAFAYTMRCRRRHLAAYTVRVYTCVLLYVLCSRIRFQVTLSAWHSQVGFIYINIYMVDALRAALDSIAKVCALNQFILIASQTRRSALMVRAAHITLLMN